MTKTTGRRIPAPPSTGMRALFAVSGILAILLGVFVLLQPAAALLAVAWLFGLYFITIGVLRIVHAIAASTTSTGYRVVTGILGLIVLVGGVLVLLNPGLGEWGVAIAIGLSWIVEGFIAIIVSAVEEKRWWSILYGVLAIIAGLIVVFLPFQSAGILLIGAAVIAIIAGVVQLVRAILGGRKPRA